MRADVPATAALGRHNPRLQQVRRIAAREEPRLSLLDGVTLIADAARLGAAIVEVYGVAARLDVLLDVPAIAGLARAGKVFAVDDATAARIAPTRSSQGVVAVVEVPALEVPLSGTIVYLDCIQDPGNVGGVVRSAAAFDAAGVACSPGCADPFSPRALRASAGHALFLPVATAVEIAPFAAGVRRAGGTVAATAGSGGVPLASWRPGPPVLLVLGSEGAGLSPEVAAECEVTVTVPTAPSVESLNVAVAAGIVLHALSPLSQNR